MEKPAKFHLTIEVEPETYDLPEKEFMRRFRYELGEATKDLVKTARNSYRWDKGETGE